MRSRHGGRSRATAAADWLVGKLVDVGISISRFTSERRERRAQQRREPTEAPAAPAEGAPPRTSDERTQRRMAEAQHGGISSAEGSARWERGENPGGLHHKAQRNPEAEADRMPERERPDDEEPQARVDRVPGGERHLPATRRGS
jgi:hypothetical protein